MEKILNKDRDTYLYFKSLTALLQVSVQILVPIQGPHPGYRILYPSYLHYRQIARAYARVLSCATTVRLDPGWRH